MRLSDLRHTNGFRMGLLFAGLFAAASLSLFGLVYWRTTDHLSHQINNWLTDETRGRAMTPVPQLERELDMRSRAEPDSKRLIALFARNRTRLAGDRMSLPSPSPTPDRPFHFILRRNGEARPFRGMAYRLPSGEVLLVARDLRDFASLRSALADALLTGGAGFLLLGLAGAVVAGLTALGRIDRVTSVIERIVNGNLSERLPNDGGGGAVDLLIQVVNRMLDEIERLMHEVKGVTEDIAHDLRTPLTRLLAGLERARRRGASAPESEIAIDEAIVEAKSILATFTALLRIAEVESGARRAGFRMLDLAGIAADVAELYDPVAESKKIALSLEAPGDSQAEIIGDSSLLFEAIGNLVDNAIKYSPPGGRVTVRVLGGSDGVGVEVSDTGPGIPEAERGAVLRRFHRLDKCRAAPGCGLGLSLVAAVARLHDLDLAIEDAAPGCRIRLLSRREAPEEPKAISLGYRTAPA